MIERTSKTHPLVIGYVTTPGVSGKLGLTIAPGKRHLGVTGLWKRDLDADLVRLRQHFKTNVLVCLLTEEELKSLGIPDLLHRAFSLELNPLWFPIVDGQIPGNVPGFLELARGLAKILRQGAHVVVHCCGGLERSGLLAASILSVLGVGPEEAVREVRRARPGAIENETQRAFLLDLAAALLPPPRSKNHPGNVIPFPKKAEPGPAYAAACKGLEGYLDGVVGKLQDHAVALAVAGPFRDWADRQEEGATAEFTEAALADCGDARVVEVISLAHAIRESMDRLRE